MADLTGILLQKKLSEQQLSAKERQQLSEAAAILAMTKAALNQYQEIAPKMSPEGHTISPSLEQGFKYNHPLITQELGMEPVDPEVERYYNYAGQVRTRILHNYLGGRMGAQLINQIGQHIQDPSRTTAQLSAQQLRNLAEGVTQYVRATAARNPDALAIFNREMQAADSGIPKEMAGYYEDPSKNPNPTIRMPSAASAALTPVPTPAATPTSAPAMMINGKLGKLIGHDAASGAPVYQTPDGAKWLE